MNYLGGKVGDQRSACGPEIIHHHDSLPHGVDDGETQTMGKTQTPVSSLCKGGQMRGCIYSHKTQTGILHHPQSQLVLIDAEMGAQRRANHLEVPGWIGAKVVV
eukprot:scaffold519224_cov39-Prasinocladus_malaysianus.AAC.1